MGFFARATNCPLTYFSRAMAAGSPIQTASSPCRESEKEQKCSRMTRWPEFANLSVSTALSWMGISRSQSLELTVSLAPRKHTSELRKGTFSARLYFGSTRLAERSRQILVGKQSEQRCLTDNYSRYRN